MQSPKSELAVPTLSCASCGAPVAEAATSCAYCRSKLAWGPNAPATPTRSVRDAVAAWASGVFGAPRKLEALISSVEIADQVLHRVFTHVARRHVYEQRLPTSNRRAEAPRLDATAVDPFSVSIAELRAATEHTAVCLACNGSGVESCGTCRTSGRVPCGHCGGHGQELRRYTKSSRWVKCTVCRGARAVPCGGCGGRGAITCRACSGSGHQLAWLTYEENMHARLEVSPSESPVIVAHRQLGEAKALSSSELAAFGTLLTKDARGPVSPEEGMDHAFLHAQTASLNRFSDRVAYQQYLKLAVIRRDARYEMCGTSGVIVLSGNDLVVAPTPAATAPIRRRKTLWTLGSFALAVGIAELLCRFFGSTVYFGTSNAVLALLGIAAWVVGTASIGGVLRSWRSGLEIRGTTSPERLAAIAMVVLLGVGVILGFASLPRLAEVQRALDAGDLPRARVVVDALRSIGGASPRDVEDADDGVTLAELARSLDGAHLKSLDGIAGRGGLHAAEARADAKRIRLKLIGEMLDGHRADDAIGSIDQWFPEWATDKDLTDVRRRGDDEAFDECNDAPCRYRTSAKAIAEFPTPDRVERAAGARRDLVLCLTFSETPGEKTQARLERLRALRLVADATNSVAAADAELMTKARATVQFAEAERAKAALLGADRGVVEELIGSLSDQGKRVAVAGIGDTGVYVSLDAQSRCRGVYVAGSTAQARSTGLDEDVARHVLSQAVGHAATVHNPSGSDTARWFEAGAPVVARWRAGRLVELRVGEASP